MPRKRPPTNPPAPPTLAMSMVRWDAHRKGNALGHVPIKSGTSYLCPRCGAHGIADLNGLIGSIFTAPCTDAHAEVSA